MLKHVRVCVTCQMNNPEQTHPVGLLHSIEKVESISMDFIIGLPKFQGKYCIIVVNQLTKFSHFFAISSKYKET
jgi:hypothetical protein